jgi:outer membrane immunogenic protein
MTPAPSVYDWSGVYFGLGVGAAFNNSEVDGDLNCVSSPIGTSPGPNLPGDAFCNSFNAAGDYFRHGVEGDGTVFTGGAMIGANWQWDAFVLGVEADVNYADFGDDSSSSSEITTGLFPSSDYVYTHSDLDANWWGTLRARMGFAHDNWLFYGTGGLAWGTVDAEARVDYCDVASCAGTSWTASGSESDTLIGWTLGAGIEYGWDNWVLGAEYLYVDLGKTDFDHEYSYSIPSGQVFLPPGVALTGNADVDYEFSVARVTAKWKF